MIEIIKKNKNAVIVLHEIYGVNSFMKDMCSEYSQQGFDVFCPDMIHGNHFLYSEAAEAYRYFFTNTGLEYYKEVEGMLSKLKSIYDKVFLAGFSVGAAIAWRCCEFRDCDGIICCYGSRIRDYISLQPQHPVLLLFAKQDSFDVEQAAEQLAGKANLELHILEAGHGFMDPYSEAFNSGKTQTAKRYIRQFLAGLL